MNSVRKKRMIIALLLPAIMLAGVAGCGSDDSDDSSADATRVSTLERTVSVLEKRVKLLRASKLKLKRQLKQASKQGQQPAAAQEPDPSTGEVNSYEYFKSESGNISCAMSGTQARCDISEKSWSPPPKPGDCPTDWGNSLGVEGGAGQILCAGDTVATPDAATLNYGESSTIGPFVCESASVGMTCTNTETGHGFSVAKEGYDTF